MKKKVAYVLLAAATFLLGVVISPIRFTLYSIGCGTGSSKQYTSSWFFNLVSSVQPYESLEKQMLRGK